MKIVLIGLFLVLIGLFYLLLVAIVALVVYVEKYVNEWKELSQLKVVVNPVFAKALRHVLGKMHSFSSMCDEKGIRKAQ